MNYLQDENNKHNGIFYACLIKDPEQSLKMVEFLVSEGVDPCLSDSLGQTPLFYASREGKGPLVEFLIKQGC